MGSTSVKLPVAREIPGTKRMPITVTGPDNRRVSTFWRLLPDGTGLVDLALTSGSTLLDQPRPLTAHTRGFGQAIAAALDHGVRRLMLTLDGNCSTDGGAGILRELGVIFLDQHHQPIRDGGIGLADMATIDLTRIRNYPDLGVVLLSEASFPLLGQGGAASVFGPRNGASADIIVALEAGLQHMASFQLLPRRDGRPAHDLAGAGAGGGSGYGLQIWLRHAKSVITNGQNKAPRPCREVTPAFR